MTHAASIPLTLGDPLLPYAASENAGAYDWLFAFITYGVTGFFFTLIIVLMVVFAWRYRRQTPEQGPRSRVSHSTAIEVAWALPPLLIMMFIFGMGLRGYTEINTQYADAMKINVVGKRWYWTFTHPYKGEPSGQVMHVVKDRPVELVITSEDVLHSVGMPAFRFTKDAVPQRYNYAWFMPTRAGEYPIFCREYCGSQHSSMLAKVVVHETVGEWEAAMDEMLKKVHEELPDDLYDQWKQAQTEEEYNAVIEKIRGLEPTDAIDDWNQVIEDGDLKPAWLVGKELWQSQGCAACHSIDGSANTGPTWVGKWGAQRRLTDGSEVEFNEEYVRESIYEPQAKIVAGYGGAMPAAPQLSQRDVDAIIALFRKLEDGPLLNDQ